MYTKGVVLLFLSARIWKGLESREQDGDKREHKKKSWETEKKKPLDNSYFII